MSRAGAVRGNEGAVRKQQGSSGGAVGGSEGAAGEHTANVTPYCDTIIIG